MAGDLVRLLAQERESAKPRQRGALSFPEYEAVQCLDMQAMKE